MPPLAGNRPAARRLAATLFELGGDALAAGVRVVTGRRASPPATALEPAPAAPDAASESARRAAAAEEAAARLDAARVRLRATIAPPGDDATTESAPEADPPESAPEAPAAADGDPGSLPPPT